MISSGPRSHQGLRLTGPYNKASRRRGACDRARSGPVHAGGDHFAECILQNKDPKPLAKRAEGYEADDGYLPVLRKA